MRIQKLQGLYAQLSPAERFRAVAEALAREDRAEANRLGDACPRKSYRIGEPAYTERLDAARHLTLVFAYEHAPDLRALGVLAQTRDALQDLLIAAGENGEPSEAPRATEGQEATQEASQRAVEALCGRGPDGTEVEGRAPSEQGLAGGLGELRDVYAAAVANAGIRIVSRREAFEAFCQECWGIAAEVALRAFVPPLVRTYVAVDEILQQIQPEPAQVAAYHQRLARGWAKAYGGPVEGGR